MEITAAHWIYLIGMITIIAVMVMRKNVLVPAVAATFLTAWAFTGNLANALSSVFNASLSAASELFNIFLIIALMTSLLGVLRAMGADKHMVMPFQKFMRNGTSSFLVIFVVTYFVSLFFWPTPAVPLIGAILLPAAIRAGLPAMAGAMAIAIAGQGMALSSDYIIQVAPGLSAVAAGADVSTIADRALVLSLITGLVAAVIVFMRIRSQIVKPDDALLEQWERTAADETVLVADETVLVADRLGGGDGRGGGISVPASGRPGAPTMSFEGETPGAPVKRAKTFALIVPLVFLAVVIYMVLGKFTDLVPETSGGAAAGLVGGTAALLMMIAAITLDGRDSLESCATHVVDGLVFAFKAMGVVIPIAGFFFIGNSDFAGKILSLGAEAEAPNFLFDLVLSTQHIIPDVPMVMGIGILLIGMATGLDGSGFSGLPLTGSLAGTLGPASGVDVETLAAIGQMGSIWTGGGALIAWSSLLAVAGFARVSVIELARQLFIPVVAGLLISTVIAVLIF
jgi:hypothetical protein